MSKEKKSKNKDTSKDKAKVSPADRLAAARAAKGNGKSKGKKVKKAIPTWKAPAEFKPFFVEVTVRTEKDGLLGSGIRATRYVGRYDPQAEDKKKFDMASYDMPTVLGVLSRLSQTTYVTNAAKRLPANTAFRLLLRANRKAKDGTLSIGFKGIWMAVKNAKTGRVKAQALEKKDVNYRKFRKASRILPAAFKDCMLPPKRTRGAKVKEADDE